NMVLPTSPLTVQTRFAFRPGDLMLLLEPGSGKNCVFMEVTSLPGTPSNQVNNDSGTYTLTAGASVAARFNPAAVRGVSYGGVTDGSVTYNTVYAPGDGIVDHFVSATPNWSQVIAVRVAVVARSALPEKPSAGAGQPCDTTTAAPTWSGNTGVTRSFDLSAD